MKGKHISKAMQRRRRKPKPFHLMSIEALLTIRDLWHAHEVKHGHSKVVKCFPQVYADGSSAQAEINARLPFSIH